MNQWLTHDREHRKAAVLELLKLELGEGDRVVGVGVPLLPEVSELSRGLRVSSKYRMNRSKRKPNRAKSIDAWLLKRLSLNACKI